MGHIEHLLGSFKSIFQQNWCPQALLKKNSCSHNCSIFRKHFTGSYTKQTTRLNLPISTWAALKLRTGTLMLLQSNNLFGVVHRSYGEWFVQKSVLREILRSWSNSPDLNTTVAHPGDAQPAEYCVAGQVNKQFAAAAAVLRNPQNLAAAPGRRKLPLFFTSFSRTDWHSELNLHCASFRIVAKWVGLFWTFISVQRTKALLTWQLPAMFLWRHHSLVTYQIANNTLVVLLC